MLVLSLGTLSMGWERCCIPKAKVKLPRVTGLQLWKSSGGRNVAQVWIVPALGQLWELIKPCRVQSSSCSQPSRRVHFPPWLCWDISGDPGGQHWSVKISMKLLKQELLKHPAPVSTPQLNAFITCIICVFFLRAAPKAAPGGAARGRLTTAEPGFKSSLLLKR